MNELAIHGRNWTIRILASVLLISVYTIVTYNIVVPNVEVKKIIQQGIRFSLTFLLAYFVFRGKKWAVLISTMVFSIGALGALISLFSEASFIAKIPLIVMTIIYLITVYHLNFSKSFQAYILYLNPKL